MDWVKRMNEAIGYIKSHLSVDIDVNEISKIMTCPLKVFQSSISQIGRVTLKEYIRRRLTL